MHVVFCSSGSAGQSSAAQTWLLAVRSPTCIQPYHLVLALLLLFCVQSAGLLGCPPSPLLGGHCSPSNSSQSDTATTADARLSLGSTAAAADGGACRHTHSTKHGAARTNPTPQGLAAASAAGAAAAGFSYDPRREWLYRLVTFPHYFTPCHSCCGGSNTPKREQLMTLFDTRAPHRVFCCHCPTPKGSSGHFSASHGRDGALLQVCGGVCSGTRSFA
jgi:hypothetical protein